MISDSIKFRNECLLIPYLKRSEFFTWCMDNKVHSEYQGKADNNNNFPTATELWYIPDEKHRTWAKLRWS